MICPKCGTMVPQGRNSCTNCGSPIGRSSDHSFEQAEKREKYENLKNKGFLQTKAGVVLLGSPEILIGIFVTISITSGMWAFSPDGFVILVGLAIGAWAVLLPIIGLALIGLGRNKLGGGILIAGSVICIPIGIIGIMAGVFAFKLDD